jgi:glutamate-1-semialdehyde aminotransferase
MLKRVLLTVPVVFVAYALAYGLPVASGGTPAALSQNQATSAQAQHEQATQGNMADMMAMHQKMTQMMADLKASDARLDQLAAQMNTATGQQKVPAIADVVNELVRQQKMMHAHMAMMHDQMMSSGGTMMKKP